MAAAPCTSGKFGVIELFAGAGGLAEGFRQTGAYDVIALSDVDSAARDAYVHNHRDATYIHRDVTQLAAHDLLEVADGRRIHGLLGGPPCQGFSLAGLKDKDDRRNKYVGDYARLVRDLKPDFLLMENVPQMLFHPQFEALQDVLRRDYVVRYTILNAARYGLPQTRHRAFVLAYRRRLCRIPTFPAPTHDFVGRPTYNYVAKRLELPEDEGCRHEEILGADPVVERLVATANLAGTRVFAEPEGPMRPLVTVWDALGDLSPLEPASAAEQYPAPATSDYQRSLRRERCTVSGHRARAHDSKLRDLIAQIPQGGNLDDVPPELWPKSHYSQAYGRLHRDGLSRTVTTYFCNAGSGRFIHPEDGRTLTVREAARLQGFRDDYEFIGTQAAQMRLVGNAVPPPLAAAIGQHVASALTGVIQ